jgi:hypothetical protein
VTTFETPEGKVTVRQADDGNRAVFEVQGSDGKSKLSLGKEVSTDDIGIVYYPGATQGEQGGMSMQTPGEDGRHATMVMLHTPDAIGEVTKFYKDHYADAAPEVSEMNMGGQQMVHLVMQEQDHAVTIMLMSNAEQGGTDIHLTRASD